MSWKRSRTSTRSLKETPAFRTTFQKSPHRAGHQQTGAFINKVRLFDLRWTAFPTIAPRLGQDGIRLHLGHACAIWRFRDTKTIVDIYGRLYDTSLDARGNLATPLYRQGLIRSPEDWRTWDKGDLFRLPERANRLFPGFKRIWGRGSSSLGLFFRPF